MKKILHAGHARGSSSAGQCRSKNTGPRLSPGAHPSDLHSTCYTSEARTELCKALAALVLLEHQDGVAKIDCRCGYCGAMLAGLEAMDLIDIEGDHVRVRDLDDYPLMPERLADAVLAKVRLLQ